MSTNERDRELANAVTLATEAHLAWLEDRDAKYVTDEYETAIDYLIEVFRFGDLPGRLRDTADIIRQIDADWQQWKQAHYTNPDALPSGVHVRLINQLMSDVDKRKTERVRSIEPIEELLAQKVTVQQIARIYEWYDDDGNPDVAKVREEIRKPGTHTGENWEDPKERRKREREQRLKTQLAQLEERLQEKKHSGPVAKESIEQLIDEGVSATQICKMKHLDLSDLEAYCSEKGLVMPDVTATVHDHRSRYDADRTEEQERILDAFGGQKVDEPEHGPIDTPDVEEAVVAQWMADPDLPAGQIAEIIAEELGVELTSQKVGRILKRHREGTMA